ncbi:MAG TPA: response regulator [Methylomirabilota bacterium]|nr:response regulator [Methylomirabilota bacterium]
MSETLLLPPHREAAAKRAPVVYFIDDSATMREVIKLAFRRESIQVITCADAASALAQFAENPPDAVITDVIMPDQDGYSVCSHIKQNPQYASIPVVLMSGVVNKTVADKAVAVQADELIRKPFQPQELISRVKTLLRPAPASVADAIATEDPGPRALSGLFASPSPLPQPVAPAPHPATSSKAAESPWPRALAEAFSPSPLSPVAPSQETAAKTPGSPPAPQKPAAPADHDAQKLRLEILRLELLVKKLQAELQIEREYNQTLELHLKTLRESQ